MLKVISDINYLEQRSSRFGEEYPGGAGYTYVSLDDKYNDMCFQPDIGSSTSYILIIDKNRRTRVRCDISKTCPLLIKDGEYYISIFYKTDNFIKGSLVPCTPSVVAASQQVVHTAPKQKGKKRGSTGSSREILGIEPGIRVVNNDDGYIGTVVSTGIKEKKIINDDGTEDRTEEDTVTVIWDPLLENDYDEDVDESMIECKTFNRDRDKCIANLKTCNWSDKTKRCSKKRGQKGKNDFLQKTDYNLKEYKDTVSQITENEYQTRKKTYLNKELNDALIKSKKQIYIPPIIINLKEDIGNAAALLSKVDAEKDLCGPRVIRDDFVKNKEKQREMIYKNIKELLKSTTDTSLKSVMEGYLKKTSNLDQVYEQLEISLGITIQFPLEIFLKLFPGTDDKILKEAEKIFAYTVCHLHDETLMEELIDVSKIYNRSRNPDDLITYISDWWDKYNPETAAWVEADSGAGRILHSLRWLNAKINNLHSFYSPATYIDAAGKKNSITNLLEKNSKTIEDFSNLEIGQRQNININSKFGEMVLDFTIERLSDTTNSQLQLVRRHILHIHKFFNLDCKKFGGAVDIGPNIDVNIIWGRLMSRVYNPDSSIYEEDNIDDDLTNEFDLCLKANKTSMDWLKNIYAIEFSKQPEYENIWSFFNDENAARIKEAMSERGITIYAPKMGPFDATKTPERIVMKIKKLEHLYAHLGVGIIKSATVTSPVPPEPTCPPVASFKSPGLFNRCKSFVAGQIGLFGRSNDCEPFTNLQTIPNRGGGHCQFDSLAQIWTGIHDPQDPNMQQISLNIQNSIREYIITNRNDFNFQGIDNQAQREIEQFLSSTPSQGGWGNAATLGAWANITGAIICVYAPGARPIRIGPRDGTALSGRRYNLYYNGTNHYEALIKREGTSFGKSKKKFKFTLRNKIKSVNKLKSIIKDILYLQK